MFHDTNTRASATPGAVTDIHPNDWDAITGGMALSIGSQSTGAGAGKVTFNPFSITRKIDVSSPT